MLSVLQEEIRKSSISLNQLYTLRATIATELARHAHRCKDDTNGVGIDNYFLMGIETSSTSGNLYLELLLGA